MGRYSVFEIGYVVVPLYMATWLLITWRLRFLKGSLDGRWVRVDILSPDPRKTVYAILALYSPLPRDRVLFPLAWLNRVLFPFSMAIVVYLFATFGHAG
jgi:hypothetical protein